MKLESLKDGTAVLIREPTRDDVAAWHRFFLNLSPEERRYLRFDVTRSEQVEKMARQAETGEVFRLLAFKGDTVVANGALEFRGEGWRRHMAEIRVVVEPAFRRLHLGALMIQSLFETAKSREVEAVEVNLVEPQVDARKVCERLGFHLDAVLRDYVKDVDGKLQSMLVMSCALDEVSNALRDFYAHDDWPDG